MPAAEPALPTTFRAPPHRRAGRLAGRLLVLLLPLLATVCAEPERAPTPVVNLAPPTYEYLTKLRLNVAAVGIDDSWVPKGDAEDQVANLAPTPPLDALRQMAQDRLVAAGNSGRAEFVIDDASITRDAAGYRGSLAVHLDVLTSDGTRAGFAEARVTRERTGVDDTPDAVRMALGEMVRLMMDDMNVEFEYQVRHSLHDYLLQSGVPGAGIGGSGVSAPDGVDTQDLAPPPGVRAAPQALPEAPPPSTVPIAPAPVASPVDPFPAPPAPGTGPTPLSQ